MKSLWQSTAKTQENALDECVQGSRTIGAHSDLVLHGGGNSSIKDSVRDITGEFIDAIYIKGSGWDMATIEPAGFAPLRLDRLRGLLHVPSISDSQMVNELRCAMLDASAPDASIEALLHALLPHRAVLHSHANAIVSLTNQPDPEALIRELFGRQVVVIPYVMPGFELAKLCNQLWAEQSNEATIGMVLLNHGLFTFGASMEEAYENHIRIITAAEERLGRDSPATSKPTKKDYAASSPKHTAALRRTLSDYAGRPMILSRHVSEDIEAFLSRDDLEKVASQGPATPDHIIRTKRLPLIGDDVEGYVNDYTGYFERNASRSSGRLEMLDPTPRIILDRSRGLLTSGKTVKDADIVHDIALHTFEIINAGERIGSYTALDEESLFDVEYWELEQAKLRRGDKSGPLTGQIALVTGAASGIGRRSAEHLLSLGACVVGIDISESITAAFSTGQWLGVQVDVRDSAGLGQAIQAATDRFGGIDILVVAAGVFAESAPITNITSSVWDRTLAINVNAVQGLFAAVHPLLKLAAPYGRVVVIGSKNVAAPGPGAAAYSASKAALTQLARVAALEWAPDGIRVNTIHPDAVFDTALWTDELLSERAAKYGMSIDAYKRRNLLSTEVTSLDVANMVGAMCTSTFQSTTGAQVPVDGGNDRVV